MGRFGKRVLALTCPIVPLLDKGSSIFLEEIQASRGSQRSRAEEVPTSFNQGVMGSNPIGLTISNIRPFIFNGLRAVFTNRRLRFVTRCSGFDQRAHLHGVNAYARQLLLLCVVNVVLHLPQALMSTDRHNDGSRHSGFGKSPARCLRNRALTAPRASPLLCSTRETSW